MPLTLTLVLLHYYYWSAAAASPHTASSKLTRDASCTHRRLIRCSHQFVPHILTSPPLLASSALCSALTNPDTRFGCFSLFSLSQSLEFGTLRHLVTHSTPTMSVRLIRVLSVANRVSPRALFHPRRISQSTLQPALLSTIGPHRSFFPSLPSFGLFSKEESRQTRQVDVKKQPGDQPQYVKPTSTDGRSPSAVYHNMSDAEYFDPNRPLRWLVAMDFSYNAWRALRAAKQLMNFDRKDTLIVFAVPPVPYIDIGDDTRFFYPPELIREAIDRSIQQMEGVHEELKDILGYYSCEVSEPGDARELVLMRLEKKEAAERIDYAVCGQRGKSRLLNIILGSVAVHLVHYAPTSVVVVK